VVIVGDENKKPETVPEPQPGFPQKKIVYAIIALAIMILAVVLIAKFGFNTDLLNPAYGEMSLVQRPVTGTPVPDITGVTTNITLSKIPPVGNEENFNLEYLMLQEKMQNENRQYSLVSTINKTENETIKNSINNVR
jgi:hypothetical protein